MSKKVDAKIHKDSFSKEGTKMFICSFCGKSRDQVKAIINGPSVCICNECIKVCIGILYDHQGYFVMAHSGRRSGKRRGLLYRRFWLV